MLQERVSAWRQSEPESAQAASALRSWTFTLVTGADGKVHDGLATATVCSAAAPMLAEAVSDLGKLRKVLVTRGNVQRAADAKPG